MSEVLEPISRVGRLNTTLGLEFDGGTGRSSKFEPEVGLFVSVEEELVVAFF